MGDPNRPSESARHPSDPIGPTFALDARVSHRGGMWIRLSGKADLAAAAALEDGLAEALTDVPLVIVDLRPLTFMDSAGLHRLIAAHARAVSLGTRLVFIRGSGQVNRLFELTGLAGRLRMIELKPGVVPGPAVLPPVDVA